jgi:hypothetical protein
MLLRVKKFCEHQLLQCRSEDNFYAVPTAATKEKGFVCL